MKGSKYQIDININKKFENEQVQEHKYVKATRFIFI